MMSDSRSPRFILPVMLFPKPICARCKWAAPLFIVPLAARQKSATQNFDVSLTVTATPARLRSRCSTAAPFQRLSVLQIPTSFLNNSRNCADLLRKRNRCKIGWRVSRRGKASMWSRFSLAICVLDYARDWLRKQSPRHLMRRSMR